jgi:hypothetical protein
MKIIALLKQFGKILFKSYFNKDKNRRDIIKIKMR